MTRRWPLRYAVALLASAVACAIAVLFGGLLADQAYMLVLFGLVLGTAILAGIGPAILATAAVILIGRFVPPKRLDTATLCVLGIEGLLVGAVGGILRTARRRASENAAANLRLEQKILEIGDDERRRIGHDLHDGLGQHLTGISLLSETISQQLSAGQTPDPANLETITRLVSEAVGITRDLAKTLSPVTLERDGFVAAMEELADTSSSLFGINCHWQCDAAEQLPLDRTRSLHLFRIVQEAVNNSVRHGKSKNIQITLSRSGAEQITVTVADDGSGLSQRTTSNPGLGLRIMQYRAKMLHAVLTVERSSPGKGTVVTCTCPVVNDTAPRS